YNNTYREKGNNHMTPYEQYLQLTEKQKFESELIIGVMWFWILWHCWHDPDALLGHLLCIHPSIPFIPDDEE
uniref:NADH dehydrogenase [ubiquinone] 1 beta subcomplex subunit 2, mitochondrial n=1 Tax=Maylandia zebra TaxID=106582 RepID=A0A3P9CZV6_9CICH